LTVFPPGPGKTRPPFFGVCETPLCDPAKSPGYAKFHTSEELPFARGGGQILVVLSLTRLRKCRDAFLGFTDLHKPTGSLSSRSSHNYLHPLFSPSLDDPQRRLFFLFPIPPVNPQVFCFVSVPCLLIAFQDRFRLPRGPVVFRDNDL